MSAGKTIRTVRATLTTEGALEEGESPFALLATARGIVSSALAWQRRTGGAAGETYAHANWWIRSAGPLTSGMMFEVSMLDATTRDAAALTRALCQLRTHTIGTPRRTLTHVHLEDAIYKTELEGGSAAAALDLHLPPLSPGHAQLHFRTRTPLSLGRGPERNLEPPDLTAILRSLFGRMHAPALPGVILSRTGESDLKRVVLMRRSARTLQRMPLSGVVGAWQAEAEIAPEAARQVAALLTHIPVGGRTGFGFGQLDLDVAETR